MGLNFRKSFKLFKGLKLNLSKSGASLSFGTKGLRQTISTSGRATTTVSAPGTGVYYTKSTKIGSSKKKSKKSSKSDKSEE